MKDTINQWLEAQVIKVQGTKAYVHYNGWGTRWDEWIEFNSPRMRNFKTYTLQSPITFCTMPYPAIPCDSNIEPQQRPIDIFFYLEKTKKHMENLLYEMNCLLNLRKKNSPLFNDSKFNMDNYEILFKATQMIPFLDRIGRMLSDISLVFSHFMVNPNYYSSFLFGYKRQDLFNEINNMKINKENKKDENNIINNIINEKDKDKNEIKTKNEDSQTPPIESKFMKKFKEEQQLQTQKEQEQENKPQTQNNKKSKDENKIIINKNETIENKNNIKDNKIEIEDKKEIIQKKEQNEIIEIKENKNEKEKNNEKKEEPKEEKENEKEKKDVPKDEKDKINKTPNEIIRENINEEKPQPHQRPNSVPSSSESREGDSANFQRQRQRQRQEEEEEILPNQIMTNLGYDLSFSSIELPFIQRIIYSYTISDRIISSFSPFYQIFSNKKLLPRVNLQVPIILSPGEVMMMTGYSPFQEPNFDVYIRTIAVSPNENNNNNNNSNNNSNNNINNNNSDNNNNHT